MFRNMVIVCIRYPLAVLLVTWLFSVVNKSLNPDSLNFYDIISLGGIFATFGSALLATIVIYEQKNEQQIKENAGILYEKILKQENWSRWSFLERHYEFRLLDGNLMKQSLSNPTLSYDVGSHIINVNLPTVYKDFNDLPIFRDFLTLANIARHL